MRLRGELLSIVLILVGLIPGLALGHMVLPVNLEEMTESAGLIVVGRCADVVPHRGAGAWFPEVEVTVVAREVLKGTVAGPRITFRQIDLEGRKPRFVVGEDLLLFLYPPSGLGLTSPVGMTQGRFVITRDPVTGRHMVSNGGDLQPLLRGLRADRLEKARQAAGVNSALMLAPTARQLDLDLLRVLVHDLLSPH